MELTHPTGANGDLFINVILWLFAIFPGTVHAWYIIITHKSDHPNLNTSASNNGERKYGIDESNNALSPDPLPNPEMRHSRDGTEVEPFTPASGGAEAAQLPSYESVAEGSGGARRQGGGRSDSKGH